MNNLNQCSIIEVSSIANGIESKKWLYQYKDLNTNKSKKKYVGIVKHTMKLLIMSKIYII